MAIIKTVNWEGGSNARYDVGRMTPEERRMFDHEGRPLFSGAPGDGPDQWTQGLPGARGGSGPGDMGGGGGGGAVAGIPGAAVRAQMQAQGLAEYKKALARFNQNRQNTLTQYGYAADIDPEQGVLKNMRVDSSNPYGLYQNLRRNNARQYTTLRDASMERRIGSKGLGAQAVSDARHEWGAADTAMGQALTQTLSGVDTEQQGAWQAYQNLVWQLELEAAREAAEAARFAAMNSGGGWDDYSGDDGGDEGGGDFGPYEPDVDMAIQTAMRARAGAAKKKVAKKKPPPKRVTQNKRPGQAGFRPF